jgi:hypothetical protein
VTQIKGTVLLMPNGSDVVTKAPAQAVQSEKKVEDSELLDLLAAPIKKEKKKVRVFLVVYHFAALRFNCLSACCLWTYVSITKVLHVAQGRPEELV